MNDPILGGLLASGSLDWLVNVAGILVIVMGLNHLRDLVMSAITGVKKMRANGNGTPESYKGPERRHCEYDHDRQERIDRNIEEITKALSELTGPVISTRRDVRDVRDKVNILASK